MGRPARIAILLLAAVAACAAIDLTTFRRDSAHYSLWDLQLEAGGSRSGHRYDTVYRETWTGLSFDGKLSWLTRTTTDDLDWLASIPLFANGWYERRTTVADTVEENIQYVTSLILSPEFTAHSFHRGTDVFIWNSARPRVEFGSDDYDFYSGQIPRRHSEFSAGFGVGPGYGRMRNAWPLLKATYIERILSKEGVLTRDLTDEELHEIAAFLSRSWKLFLAHDRGSRHFYDSLATLLMRTGATRGALPARALIRMDEGLFVGNFGRRFGWQVRAGAEAGGYARWYWTEMGDSSWVDSHSSAYVYPEASAEYAVPIGLEWFFDSWLKYQLRLTPEDGRVDRHVSTLAASAGWQALDRLAFMLTPEAVTTYIPPWDSTGTGRLVVDPATTLSCDYYLAERLRAVVSLRWVGNYDSQRTESPSGGLGPAWTHYWSLDFKLHWGPLPPGWGYRVYL